jgi:hypothetical protein
LNQVKLTAGRFELNDYIFLMHNDVAPENSSGNDAAWSQYISGLRTTGRFGGGSSIGHGVCVRKTGPAGEITMKLGGYITVQAENIEEAKKLLVGNPVFEAGGSVEIRDLPRE